MFANDKRNFLFVLEDQWQLFSANKQLKVVKALQRSLFSVLSDISSSKPIGLRGVLLQPRIRRYENKNAIRSKKLWCIRNELARRRQSAQQITPQYDVKRPYEI